jgi:hypothetical protein
MKQGTQEFQPNPQVEGVATDNPNAQAEDAATEQVQYTRGFWQVAQERSAQFGGDKDLSIKTFFPGKGKDMLDKSVEGFSEEKIKTQIKDQFGSPVDGEPEDLGPKAEQLGSGHPSGAQVVESRKLYKLQNGGTVEVTITKKEVPDGSKTGGIVGVKTTITKKYTAPG